MNKGQLEGIGKFSQSHIKLIGRKRLIWKH